MQLLTLFFLVLHLATALVPRHLIRDDHAALSSAEPELKRDGITRAPGAEQKCRYRCPSKCGVLKGMCHQKQGTELRACHLDICKKDIDCTEANGACCGLNCPVPEAEVEAEVLIKRSNDYELSNPPAQATGPETDKDLSLLTGEGHHIEDSKRGDEPRATDFGASGIGNDWNLKRTQDVRCPKACATDCGQCAEGRMSGPHCKIAICYSCTNCGVKACDAYCKTGQHLIESNAFSNPNPEAMPGLDAHKERGGVEDLSKEKRDHSDMETVERSVSDGHGAPSTAAYCDGPYCCPLVCKQLGATCQLNKYKFDCILGFCKQHPECAINIHCKENRICSQARQSMGVSDGGEGE